jgi:hypothetical protein
LCPLRPENATLEWWQQLSNLVGAKENDDVERSSSGQSESPLTGSLEKAKARCTEPVEVEVPGTLLTA